MDAEDAVEAYTRGEYEAREQTLLDPDGGDEAQIRFNVLVFKVNDTARPSKPVSEVCTTVKVGLTLGAADSGM
jgi:hypothetical protein